MSRGNRGRGRGGSRSSSRPTKSKGEFRNRKFYKKRGRGGRGGFNSQDSRSYNELDDLENSDFVSINAPQDSMKASAARSSRNRRMRLQDEVFQTENNIENTMKLPLRKRPVEFIKAELYDPTQDLIKRLSEKSKNQLSKPTADKKEPIIDKVEVIEEPQLAETIKAQIIEDLDDIILTSDSEIEEDGDIPVKIDNANKHKEKIPDVKSQPSPKKPKIQLIPDDQLFFIDHAGESIPKPVKKVYVEDPKPKPIPGSNLEYDPTFSVGKVLLTTTRNSNGELFTSLPKITKKLKNLDNFNPDSSIYELADDAEDLYELNNRSNQNLYKSYDDYLQNVMDNLQSEGNEDDDDGEDVYDELDDDFEEEANFIASAERDDEDEHYNYDDIDINDNYDNNDDDTLSITATTVGNLTIDSDSEFFKKKKENNEPEYGFLPEDYETFDNNLVETIKIRYGSNSNKYFLKCFKMTGLYDFQWVDQDDFEDFLLENGMPEHRLTAYLKFIEKQVTPEEKVTKEDFDLPISDSSDEDEEDYGRGIVDSDEEGLDDLIQFTKKYDGLRDMIVEPTHGLSTRGRKKKELILDHIDDEDLRKSLQEQFDVRFESKREKKKRWDQNVAKGYEKSQDLSLKYPYTLHIKEIRNEFDTFYQDQKRNSLAFPPMDPHGIKTIQKIAYYYNMKSRKFGAGNKSHAVVIKNKRTFRCNPDHHSVNQLMRQRPVFNRIDQKRPKSEVEYEQGKSSRRGKPSKAHVQEGEIVGGNAPEIASNNVGRLLLMKMGWSSGQGLGADNKGISEPVVAKVKKTKLGIR